MVHIGTVYLNGKLTEFIEHFHGFLPLKALSHCKSLIHKLMVGASMGLSAIVLIRTPETLQYADWRSQRSNHRPFNNNNKRASCSFH